MSYLFWMISELCSTVLEKFIGEKTKLCSKMGLKLAVYIYASIKKKKQIINCMKKNIT